MSRHAYQMPFSPGGEFVWNRKVPHDGKETQIGERVDKAKFTPIRLRQMYECRMIVPAPFGDMAPPNYLNNGIGKADKLRKEIEAEEGKGNAASTRPAKANAAPAKKPLPAAKSAPAKKAKHKPAPAAKQRGRRAA